MTVGVPLARPDSSKVTVTDEEHRLSHEGEIGGSLWERLARSAEVELRGALSAMADSPPDVRQFYVRGEASLELMLKAVLVQTEPLLIVDGSRTRAEFVMAFARSGGQIDEEVALGVRTIRMSELRARCSVLLPEQTTQFDRAIDDVVRRRNAYVHLGQATGGYELDHVSAVLEVFQACCTGLGRSFESALGNHLAAARHWMDEAADVYAARVNSRIAEARQLFGWRYEEGPPEDLGETLHSDEWKQYREAQPVTCPACETLATGFGELQVDVEADYDREGVVGAYLVPEFVVHYFRCRACDLEVDGPELEPAGIPALIHDLDHLTQEQLHRLYEDLYHDAYHDHY